MAAVNLHAGHNPDGKTACGAVGLIKESTEARRMVKKIKKILKKNGVKVYDCTCDDGVNQSDVLQKIIKKCNAHHVDLDISLHFNSGRNDLHGDGRIAGTEVWMRTAEGVKKKAGIKICKGMEQIGFTNRGVKTTKGLYFLNHTKAPAILIEICFVDDKDDVKIYKKSKDLIAEAVAKGILISLSS